MKSFELSNRHYNKAGYCNQISLYSDKVLEDKMKIG